jgi:hypothetical protein
MSKYRTCTQIPPSGVQRASNDEVESATRTTPGKLPQLHDTDAISILVQDNECPASCRTAVPGAFPRIAPIVANLDPGPAIQFEFQGDVAADTIPLAVLRSGTE